MVDSVTQISFPFDAVRRHEEFSFQRTDRNEMSGLHVTKGNELAWLFNTRGAKSYPTSSNNYSFRQHK